MMKGFHIPALAALLLSMFASHSLAVDARLTKLQEVYASSMKTIAAEKSKAEKLLPVQYQAEIKQLQASFQAAGDLDSWRVIQSELTRFKSSPNIPEPVGTTLEQLAGTQRKYRERNTEVSLQSSRQILDLVQKYSRALSNLQAELTRAGKIPDAVAVSKEEARVKASSEVKAAEFELAQATAMNPTTPPPEPATPAPPPSVAAAERSGSEKKGGFTLHYDRVAPDIPDVHLKRMTLRNTPNVRTGRRVSVTYLMGTQDDVSKDSAHSYYSTSTSKSGSTDYLVRLAMRATSTADTVENATLYVEYFGKSIKSGNALPSRISQHMLELPSLSSAIVHVDCPTFSTSSSSYSYTSSYGYHSSSKSGMDFYGAIISVFDADKKLVFQAASNSRLCNQAVSEFPDHADVDNLKKLYDEARRRYTEVNRISRRDRDDPEQREAVNAARKEMDDARRNYEAATAVVRGE